LRHRRVKRRQGDRNHCGGSRAAAEPVADSVVVALEPGATLVSRLAATLTASPVIDRFVIVDAEFGAIEELLSAATGHDVTVKGLMISDTCKEVVGGLVQRTVPRETVVDARGPWVFTRDALAAALARIRGRESEVRDVVALSRAAGLPIHVLMD